jgi:predicted HicB family RNase H-like nuclease
MELSGEPVPTSLTERRYGGSFMVRTSPALHARLTIEAAEQRVSLNQWIIQKLAERPAVFD